MTPLENGLAALSAVPVPDDRMALIVTKCRALLVGYAARWQDDAKHVPVEVEQIVSSPLLNPATGRKARELAIAGKRDLVTLSGGRLTLWDHKTCSEDIEDPDATYWRQLVVEAQPTHYMLLGWLNGQKLDAATWDVLRKPSISPKQLKSKAERVLAISNRSYFNRRLSDRTLQHLQESDRENLEMYEARLVHDCTMERPGWYFQRRTVPRLDAEIADYASDVWEAGQLLLASRKANRGSSDRIAGYPKHPGACMAYGSPCRYLGICSQFDRADSPNWKRREQAHNELTPEQDQNTLTFSSLRTYQLCPRRFYYQYELCIERIDEEEREALLFGHVWHLCLEAYWAARLPQETHDGSDSCAADSAASGCGAETRPF